MPTAKDFAALARSSPWLWRTVRFTLSGRDASGQRPVVRAFLRRPDRLRVESAGGSLLQIVHEPRGTAGVLTFGPGGGPSTAEQLWPTEPGAPQPAQRADGLVISRPGGWPARTNYDAPMYQNYYWVALLDPVELADGAHHETGEAVPGTAISEVTEVDQHGRVAWQALVTPTRFYEPRCGCCALLRSSAGDEAEWDRPLLSNYPDAYRVRLDRETGICVSSHAIGGDPVTEHDVHIEAVNEPLGDDLFVDRRRPPHAPPSGWAPVPPQMQ